MFDSNFQKSMLKFMPKTVCNLIETPFLPTITFLYLATNWQTTETTAPKCRCAIKPWRGAGPRAHRVGMTPRLALARLSFPHPDPWPPEPSTNSCPDWTELGQLGPPSPSQGSQTTGHKLPNPAQCFRVLREAERRNVWEQNIISSAISHSARCCP